MHILILGAGYAGVRAALDLDQLRRESSAEIEVTLVDQHPYHQIIQVLHLTATEGNYTREAIVELERIFRGHNIRLVEGCVTRIEPLQRRVVLDDGRNLAYDRLVIALGATTNYGGVPGAREHSLPMRTFDEAVALREHFHARFSEAARTNDPKRQRILLTTAIIGGGYTGCQLAGELAVWAPELCSELGAPRSEVRIALLDRGPLLLKQFGDWASAMAVRVLDRRGISVYLNTAAERVEAEAVYVSGNRVLRAATIVWAGGIGGLPLFAEAGLPVNTANRILVDRYLRVRDHATIFAIGDSALIADERGELVPATASYALRQGIYLAEALIAEAEGRAPRQYDPVRLGDLVSLGPGEAIGNPFGVPVFGKPAVLLKKGVEQYYRATISP